MFARHDDDQGRVSVGKSERVQEILKSMLAQSTLTQLALLRNSAKTPSAG